MSLAACKTTKCTVVRFYEPTVLAVALMLQYCIRLSSVCRLCHSVAYVLVAKRCVLVTIDSLQEIVYEESISTKMNDLDLCIEAV